MLQKKPLNSDLDHLETKLLFVILNERKCKTDSTLTRNVKSCKIFHTMLYECCLEKSNQSWNFRFYISAKSWSSLQLYVTIMKVLENVVSESDILGQSESFFASFSM